MSGARMAQSRYGRRNRANLRDAGMRVSLYAGGRTVKKSLICIVALCSDDVHVARFRTAIHSRPILIPKFCAEMQTGHILKPTAGGSVPVETDSCLQQCGAERRTELVCIEKFWSQRVRFTFGVSCARRSDGWSGIPRIV